MSPPSEPKQSIRCAVVGAGRVGTALCAALAGADGPFGRGYDGGDHDVVLLAVPDRSIADAAAAVTVSSGRFVGHCSGATPLDVLAPHRAFGLHPLMTFAGGPPHPRSALLPLPSPFEGSPAAVAGADGAALDVAQRLALELGMHPFQLGDGDRATYHAAASIASNFLVTIEDAAGQLLEGIGLDRSVILPLARTTLDNWARQGSGALTGPVARGDHATVARQRSAIASHRPDLLDLFDALVAATERVAAAQRTATSTAASSPGTEPSTTADAID